MLSERLLSAAISTAQKGPGVGRRANYRVGAVLFDRSHRILQSRTNSYKTHPTLARYSRWPFLHAESSCLIHHGLDHCDGLSLLVTRVSASGRPTMAKPCSCCEELIKDSNLKFVYYTDWNGAIQCL